ncbi:MAG TPA: protein kinase [Polyangiaceae bacterium]|nr:protein kinase [Polyangiaceae bacterium]
MAGEYRLLRKLGEGGFGAVYEAEHPLLKRRAAVKVLHRVADKDSDAVLRFISEAQAVNQIRNRHIIDVFSFGQLSDGRHFYVMDLLDGEPLDRWLKYEGRIDAATALKLLTPIAGALDLAHGAGIVHRDLKPQNIFLAWDTSGDTVPKLLDFGMAKLLGDSPVHTVSGTPIGTPLYMSPEQARGEKVDQRSDVYSLGVLCHEMLTGQLPFLGDTTVAVLMAHIIQAPPKGSETCAEVSPLLDAPLLRMLDKDPTARPASAGEAIQALRRAAIEAGVEIDDAPLHLVRHEPAVSGETPRGEPDTLLDDSDEVLSAAAAASAGSAPRPLWPFGLGLLVLGGLLGFVVLRGPAEAPPAEAVPRVAAQAPSVVAVPAVSPLPSASAEPSSLPAPSANVPVVKSAAVAAPRASDAKKASKPRPSSAAHIPTDLENPF